MSQKIPSSHKDESLGEDIASTVNDVLTEAKPVLSRMANRINESMHDLASQGKEDACEAAERLEGSARQFRFTVEEYIKHSPFKSVLIAAGTGAATAIAFSWYMNSRKN